MPIVLRGGSLLDGTGAPPVPDATVVIADGRLTAIAREREFGSRDWSGYEVIDARGGTIMPGLVNAHEHVELRNGYGSYQERAAQPMDWGYLRAARNVLLALQEGVTTLRDAGAKGALALTVRRAVRDGLLVGPRVVACGQPLTMTGGHGAGISWVADGPDAVRQGAREQLKNGADFIKCMASGGNVNPDIDQPMWPQYTVEEMRAAFEEAHKQGKSTTVHVHPPAAIRNAIEAGVDCIEHCGLVDRETAELIAKRGIPVVPTLSESWNMANYGLERGRPQWLVERARSRIDDRMTRLRSLVDAGCMLAAGTDGLGDMVTEIRLLAEGGLGAMGALVAATRNGAQVCGLLDETGTLEVGKVADVIVLRGDPLADFSVLAGPKTTVVRGLVYRSEELATATGKGTRV